MDITPGLAAHSARPWKGGPDNNYVPAALRLSAYYRSKLASGTGRQEEEGRLQEKAPDRAGWKCRACRALTRQCGELTRQWRGTDAAVAVLLPRQRGEVPRLV
ncbi:hypothetical protein B0H13DRAFT_2325196 [Mycena leptocephala]|nr:hypothetical protein B0H13DRAFT_2325196 [Mycena leptocephala]